MIYGMVCIERVIYGMVTWRRMEFWWGFSCMVWRSILDYLDYGEEDLVLCIFRM